LRHTRGPTAIRPVGKLVEARDEANPGTAFGTLP
jgi:hypothetical protein